MDCINLISKIQLENGKVLGSNLGAVELCRYYSNYGADGIIIIEKSNTDAEHELNIDTVKEIVSAVDIPVYLGGNVKRLEDVKKYLYAGAKCAILDLAVESNTLLVKEAADRFGKEKIMVANGSFKDIKKAIEEGATYVLAAIGNDVDYEAKTLYEVPNDYIINKNINADNTFGLVYSLNDKTIDYMAVKHQLEDLGYKANLTKCSIDFKELKTNENGLIPVVVQDYQTNDVLMLAYMNEEAFNATISTGRMTYFSRSRNELWEKGLTSGHFQYLKSLEIDCDNDTLLAKVYQVGAACHTNNRSCFYRNIYKKDYKENNPHKVFEDVYNVILDRKEHPKEGSYTNYLFDKGIDKILKKVGEECTEIVIAAKNPNPEEIKYEISDFLYHVMVLMAERGVTWEDVTTELSRR